MFCHLTFHQTISLASDAHIWGKLWNTMRRTHKQLAPISTSDFSAKGEKRKKKEEMKNYEQHTNFHVHF